MIDLYYWPTPNGHKVTILLEELDMKYNIKPVNIGAGEQFTPAFLQISPNNKMPAMVDDAPGDGSQLPISIFESGAILMYLADKARKFLPHDLHDRYEVLQWLFWQVGGLGPMAGQNHHFVQYANEKIPYAIDRYVKETNRLYGVLDKQLANHDYIANDYSIADMACYPWIVGYENQKQNIDDFPNIKRWLETMKNRPAVQRAYEIGTKVSSQPVMNEDAKKILFGQDSKSIQPKDK